MAYFEELFVRAFWETWALIPGKPVAAAMIAILIFGLRIGYALVQHRNDQVKLKLKDWCEATLFAACVFVATFLVHFFYLSPRAMVEELRSQLPQVQSDEWPPLTNEQATQLVKLLSPLHVKSIQVAWGMRVKAEKLFKSFRDVGNRLPDCSVEFNQGAYTDGKAIELDTGNIPLGEAFLQFFQQVGWPVEFERPKQPNTKGEIFIILPQKD